MTISIVIPTYKDPKKYRCFKSIFNSTYTDLELLNESDYWHEGPATIRNRTVKRATGDILFFMDSDATVYPDTLGKIAKRMKDLTIDGISIAWDSKPLEQDFFSKFKAIEMNYLMTKVFPCWCGSNGTAIRANLFEEFDESFKEAGTEDFEWGLRMLSKYNIVPCRDILMQHSYHGGMFKYFKRAFNRARLLASRPYLETGYSSRGFISLLYKPNSILYKQFYQSYGLWFALRTTVVHRLYMLGVVIAGGLGYASTRVFNILRNRKV